MNTDVIHCDGCSVACAETHELPVEISRRKVITVNEGKQGMEVSLSVHCVHVLMLLVSKFDTC